MKVAELIEHRLLLESTLVEMETMAEGVTKQGPGVREFFICEFSKSITGVNEAGEDVIFDAIDVCFFLSWKLWRQDQMVKGGLKHGHSYPSHLVYITK